MSDYTIDDFEENLKDLLRKSMAEQLMPHEVLMSLKYKTLELEHAIYRAVDSEINLSKETH